MTVIALANESGMGTMAYSWTSPSAGFRARVVWGPGMRGPMVCCSFPGRPEIAREITRPERFGWVNPSALPGRKQTTAVRALAAAYAAAFEEEMASDDDV